MPTGLQTLRHTFGGGWQPDLGPTAEVGVQGGQVVIRPQSPFMSAVQEKAQSYEDLEILELKRGGRRTIESIRRRTQPRSGHMLNFIECMRSRELPHLNADAGYRVMTTIGLAVEAYRENRVKLFDPDAEAVV